MTKNINIELSDEEYENLSKYKEKRGFTWKGMLKAAPLFDERERDFVKSISKEAEER